jgi:hypothetical protein
MPSFTVQNFIDRAATRADMKPDDEFVTPTQWLHFATEECRELDLQVLRHGYVPREVSVDITTTTELSYTIADPLAVLGVFEVEGGRYRFVAPADMLLGPAGRRAAVASNADIAPATSYRMTQNDDNEVVIEFYPYPGAGKTYRVFYVPERATFASAADTVNYPGGIERRVVVGMARQAIEKEEASSGRMLSQIQEADLMVERFCWGRQQGAPQVRNTDRELRGWLPSPFRPSRDLWQWI